MPKAKASGGKKIVCIIEDDQFLVKAYQIKFEKEGLQVVMAKDGKEALGLIGKDPVPGVILLDLMLPTVTGFDVLEAIKKDAKWKSAPVIVMSNLGQQQDIDKCKALGAEEYLVKANVKIADVVDKVKKYL